MNEDVLEGDGTGQALPPVGDGEAQTEKVAPADGVKKTPVKKAASATITNATKAKQGSFPTQVGVPPQS